MLNKSEYFDRFLQIRRNNKTTLANPLSKHRTLEY